MSEAAASSRLPLAAGASRLLSDDRLARRATKGDQQAFAAIYRRYHQDLYRFCHAIVGNPQDAQDALQNTMVKVLRALPGEKRTIQLKPWLYRIANNESIELLRRRRPGEAIEPELIASNEGPMETAALNERVRGLVADLGELPERQRAALVMREMGDLGFDQIAAALGTSEQVVRQTLYEARLSLLQMEAGREMSCQKVTKAISDADGRVLRRREIRAHLRGCASCREFRVGIERRQRDLAALAPLPLAASTGLLHGVLGAGSSSVGGSLSLGGAAGAGKAIAVSTLAKSAATVAVVAAVGVTAADRSGLIDTPLPVNSQQSSQGDTSTQAHSDGAAAGSPTGGDSSGGAGAGSQQAGAGKANEGSQAAAGQAGGRSSHGQPSSAGQRGSQGHVPAAAGHGQQTAATHGGGRPSHSPSVSQGHSSSHGHSSHSGGHSTNQGQSHVSPHASGGTVHSPATHPTSPPPPVAPDKGEAGAFHPANPNAEPAIPSQASG